MIPTVVSTLFSFLSRPTPSETTPMSKSIAIVGAGTAGIAALKALLDLPEDVRHGWRIDLFEQRADVGGVWLPQPQPPAPPSLPETPLYPALRTNTPHPTMTYPNFPFPPTTPLYPNNEPIRAYHDAYARHFQLIPHIHLSHTVTNATYDASVHWRLTVLEKDSEPSVRTYDHLVIANGHYRYPHEPTWVGQEEWLKEGEGLRQILHSLWYREPERYSGQTVIVVGDMASGRDMAQQVVNFADKVYHSYDKGSLLPHALPPAPGTIPKPRISHFTRSSVVFTDNTTVSTLSRTTILLGTGYELLAPFLSPLSVSAAVDSSTSSLTTNLHYIRPLYKNVFSLDPCVPPNALAFIGLRLWIANAPSDYAQGLLVAHAIADPNVLPSREVMLQELNDAETALQQQSVDPFRYGHGIPDEGANEAYMNGLVDFVRANSKIPLSAFLANNEPYVKPWRRWAREQTWVLRRGWLRAEKLGIQETFISGAKTEEEWVLAMEKLWDWEQKQAQEEEPTDVVEELL